MLFLSSFLKLFSFFQFKITKIFFIVFFILLLGLIFKCSYNIKKNKIFKAVKQKNEKLYEKRQKKIESSSTAFSQSDKDLQKPMNPEKPKSEAEKEEMRKKFFRELNRIKN